MSITNIVILVLFAAGAMGGSIFFFFEFGRSWEKFGKNYAVSSGNVLWIPGGLIMMSIALLVLGYVSSITSGGYPCDTLGLRENAIYEVIESDKSISDSYGVLVRMPNTDCLRLFRYDKKLTPGTYRGVNKAGNDGLIMELEPFKYSPNQT